MANNYDSSDGVWRTIGGRKVFIRNGQSLSEAMKESGKFKNLKEKEDELSKQADEYVKSGLKDDYYKYKEIRSKSIDDWTDEDTDFMRKNDSKFGDKYFEETKNTFDNKKTDLTIQDIKGKEYIINNTTETKDGMFQAKELENGDYLLFNAERGEFYEVDNINEDTLNKYRDTKEKGMSVEDAYKKYSYAFNENKNKELKLKELNKQADEYVKSGQKQNEKEQDDYKAKIEQRQHDDMLKNKFGIDKENMTNEQYEESLNSYREMNKNKTEMLENETKSINDEKEILDRYGEDYGYDKNKSNIENLKSQIDYMRNPNESINQTAQRLVEGGDFLIYNGDIKDWLDERGIKYNEDNFFEVYKKEMANKIEKLYNEDNVKQVMTNKDLQKQVAMDVAKSFGAKNVKVNGEEINLEASKNNTNNDTSNQIKQQSLDYDDIWENKMSRADKAKINQLNNDYAHMQGSPESRARVREEQEKIYQKYANTESKSTNKTMNDKIRNKAYQKYMKEHPNSKMTLEQFLKKK